MNGPILKIDHMNFRYHDSSRLALNNISFQIPKESWTSIIGTNGSGKSTLVKLIDGLLMPQSGEIQIDGRRLTSTNADQLRSNVGVVFQNPADQFVNTTVKDDLAFGLENLRISARRMNSIIDTNLRLVGMLTFKDALLQNLSGGQKQRIALAEVLVVRPRIIIFDESTSMLNPLSRYRILRLVRRLQNRFHLTILGVTHDIEETKSADQIIVLHRGRLMMDDSPRQVFKHESFLKRLGLRPPQVDILRELLIRKGVSLPNTYLSETEMINWLSRW